MARPAKALILSPLVTSFKVIRSSRFTCERRGGRGELGRMQGRIPASVEGWSLMSCHKAHCESICHTCFCPIKQHGVWRACPQIDYKLYSSKKTKQKQNLYVTLFWGFVNCLPQWLHCFCKPSSSTGTFCSPHSLVWLWWEPSLLGGSVSLSLTEVGLEQHPYSCMCFMSTSFIPHQPWPSATHICFHELSDCIETRNEKKILTLLLLSTGITFMCSLYSY